MALTRRAFAAYAVAFSSACSASFSKPRKLHLLVLGGTSYLGPQIVEAALRQGHQVTLFNRGKTNPNMFPALELIRGDRDAKTENLSGLENDRRWDAVIDVWPADYKMSHRSGELLKDRVGRYIYVSSISAYSPLTVPGANESYPLIATSADLTDYGYSKAETERRLQSIYGSRFSAVRPCPIFGWRNDSDALTFWAVRLQRGGEVVGPGDGNDPIQWIDVKDVGEFVIRIAERSLVGPFNVIGPAHPFTFRQYLERIRRATGDRANVVWIPDEFLVSQGLGEYSDWPDYRPLKRSKVPGFFQQSASRALAEGMTLRPLEQTVGDELRWFPIYRGVIFDFGGAGRPKDTPYWLRMGITRERELALIKSWRHYAKT